jgi:hypothetical protein
MTKAPPRIEPAPTFRPVPDGEREGFKDPQRADDPTPGINGKVEP